jgi:hypothetical protein
MAPEVQDPKKLLKIVNCAKTEKTERSNGGGPSGIGGWPPISTWIRRGFKLFVSRMIIPRLQVSADPKVDNRAFLYEGKLWRTSKVDIVQGVCDKSSTTE